MSKKIVKKIIVSVSKTFSSCPIRVGFMFCSSSSCFCSFTFQSSEFSSSSISRWSEMITELELSLYNRTGRRNDNSARGDEMVQWCSELEKRNATSERISLHCILLDRLLRPSSRVTANSIFLTLKESP